MSGIDSDIDSGFDSGFDPDMPSDRPAEIDLDLESIEARYPNLEVVVLDAQAEAAPGAEIRIGGPAAEARAMLGWLAEEAAAPPLRLVDLTAIDRGSAETGAGGALEVVYRLRSDAGSLALQVVARVGETGAGAADGASPSPPDEPGEDAPASRSSIGGEPVVDSVAGLWPVANWLEREVFDLFGIRFRGHPDLRRLLLEDTFEGAPLRKAHPLALERALPDEERP